MGPTTMLPRYSGHGDGRESSRRQQRDRSPQAWYDRWMSDDDGPNADAEALTRTSRGWDRQLRRRSSIDSFDDFPVAYGRGRFPRHGILRRSLHFHESNWWEDGSQSDGPDNKPSTPPAGSPAASTRSDRGAGTRSTSETTTVTRRPAQQRGFLETRSVTVEQSLDTNSGNFDIRGSVQMSGTAAPGPRSRDLDMVFRGPSGLAQSLLAALPFSRGGADRLQAPPPPSRPSRRPRA
ncbi:hypothetical protein MAPG_11647 [Magnaporthiopsis poae ATCC 64411]|uniref:Uncharacterized protein n=1 Tax=Magnaporthiopsis poae (strain ATCC 64411 / 73-15) TaxID=644358 RepID=A0A0C4EFU0_MAGP6|nr:hypothetical protein MAPG_11647 [Magnaporthiopsis poae ATCC 64411]